MSVPFTLLHLSDLHFGPHCRFQGQDMSRLAAAVADAVGHACRQHALGDRVDVVDRRVQVEKFEFFDN